ncbi:hypothetical protein Tco_1446595 [Tanacetum coccineum]
MAKLGVGNKLEELRNYYYQSDCKTLYPQPADYDLCLMRIEQYFLMTDYSLWEVVKNCNKVLKKTIRNVEQDYEPTSVEEKLDSTNSKSNSSTNEAYNTAYGVSAAHTQGNAVNFTSLDNLCDTVICAFLASQPNSPQLSQEDLEQLHPDDLEEMDLQ